jgi:hypothetical protein
VYSHALLRNCPSAPLGAAYSVGAMVRDDMPLLPELGPSGCRRTINMSLPSELFRGESHPSSARLHLG